MKQYITAIAATLLMSLVGTAQECPDTLMVAQSPKSAIITETPTGLTVTVIDNEDSTTVWHKDYAPQTHLVTSQHNYTSYTALDNGVFGMNTGANHWDVVSGGIGIGLVNALNQPAGFGLQWRKSFEISWVNAFAVRYRNRGFSTSLGIGFDWRNYKMTGQTRMVGNGNGGITLGEYPEGSHPHGANIKVFSLGFPLLFSQNFGRSGWGLTAGAILNVNTHAALKCSYQNAAGNEMQEYLGNIHQRRVTVDLLGCLRVYKSCGFYVRYSPQSVLRGYGSPDFKPLSIGVMLFL